MSCVAMCSSVPDLLRVGGHQAGAQRVERLVDVGLLRIRDVRRLEVGALDDADGRPERDHGLDVFRRADRGTPGSRCRRRALLARERLNSLDGRIDVRRPLHVDPHEVAELLGALDQPIHVALAERAIEVEAELRRLDRDVRVEAGRRHLVEHLEVVLRDFLGFFGLGQVLAEPRQDGVDPELLLLLGGLQRVLDPLAGHEPGDRPAARTPHLVAWSRSHGLVDAASSAFLITLIEET